MIFNNQQFFEEWSQKNPDFFCACFVFFFFAGENSAFKLLRFCFDSKMRSNNKNNSNQSIQFSGVL